MAKIKKKKLAKTKISPSYPILENRVVMIIRIFGREESDLRGLNSLKVLTAVTFAKDGWIESIEAITTKKSNQFHASLKYVCFPNTNPNATTLIKNSTRNTTVKKCSELFTYFLDKHKGLQSYF